jgi:hypothetical protein
MVNQRGVLFEADDAQGYNPFQPTRYWRFLRAVDRRRLDYNAAVLTRLDPAALDLLGVRAVVARSERPPESGDARVAVAGRWALYGRANAPPRAQAFTAWRAAGSSDAALAAVTPPGFVPERGLVVEGMPSRRGPAGSVPVRVVSSGVDTMTLTVTVPAEAVVLVRAAFDPGWRARVDGRTAPVVPADFIDLGVTVPAGRHTVHLTYQDRGIGWGLAGSLVFVVGLAGAAVALRRRSRPDREPDPSVRS